MIDYTYKDLFMEDSINKQLIIEYGGTVITNEDLFDQTMTLEESLCSEQELRFGSCEASVLKFKVANIAAPTKGKWLSVKMVLNNHTDEPFTIGRYKVDEDKLTSDRKWREIVAYDAMYEILNSDVAEWYNYQFQGPLASMTMKQFRTSFIEHFNLETEDITLVNDNMLVFKTIEASELSGKDVINAICEINGCFGKINRQGRFEFVYLPANKYVEFAYPSEDLFPSEKIFPGETADIRRIGRNLFTSCQYEDFETQPINLLWILGKEESAGIAYPDVSWTPAHNRYVIENNFLTYGLSANQLKEIAKNIYDVISKITYRPYSANIRGNPCIETGDPIRVVTKHTIVESYVLKRILTGIQSLKDDVSAEGVEKYSGNLNSVGKSVIELRQKTNTLTRTVDETVSEIYSLDENGERVSRIEQNAESIKTEVTARESGEEELSSRIEQTATSIEMSVTNGEKTAGIKIKLKNENGEEIDSDTGSIAMTGVVTFNNLKNDGQTIINGSNITTGQINCSLLNGGTITGQTINGGTISGAQIYSGGAGATSYTTIENGEMRTNSLHMAERDDESGYGIANIYHGPSTGHLSDITFKGNNIQISPHLLIAPHSYDTLDVPGNASVVTSERIYTGKAVCPSSDLGTSCGASSYRWTNVYSQHSAINTSDANEKHDIEDISKKYEELYFKLKPKSFLFNNGDRKHIGIVAQDLKESMNEVGITDTDLAAFCRDVKMKAHKTENGEVIEVDELDDTGQKQYIYGVRYSEFVMLNTHMIQKLYKKIDEQQKQINRQQEEINSLKESVSFLMERSKAYE